MPKSKPVKAVFIIHCDGTITKELMPKPPSYERLKEAVGGFIETVPHLRKLTYEGKSYTRGMAYCNEDGIAMGLPINHKATEIWRENLGPGPFSYRPILRGQIIFYASEVE